MDEGWGLRYLTIKIVTRNIDEVHFDPSRVETFLVRDNIRIVCLVFGESFRTDDIESRLF